MTQPGLRPNLRPPMPRFVEPSLQGSRARGRASIQGSRARGRASTQGSRARGGAWTARPLGRFNLLFAAVLLGGCVQASQIYPLGSPPGLSGAPEGSVQIERIEGDQRLLALKLENLAPPESWGPGYALFVTWVEDSRGHTVKVGPLRYDRARRSGTLLSAVPEPDGRMDFRAFTVKVTAEREAETRVPSGVLLAERHVKNQ